MYMGRLERENRKKKSRENLQKLVLESVMLSGMLRLALVAPNVLSAMGELGLLPSKRQKESINAARDRLIRKGLLTRNKNGLLRITSDGKRVLEKMQTFEQGLPKKKRWDGKWRVLIFDIPEYRRLLRTKLRHSLRTVGFKLLQDSVWVYPHDCEDFVALLKADFKIGKDVRYIIADTIEGDASLKKDFNVRQE